VHYLFGIDGDQSDTQFRSICADEMDSFNLAHLDAGSKVWIMDSLWQQQSKELQNRAIKVFKDLKADLPERISGTSIAHLHWLMKHENSLWEQSLRHAQNPGLLFSKEGQLVYINAAASKLFKCDFTPALNSKDFNIDDKLLFQPFSPVSHNCSIGLPNAKLTLEGQLSYLNNSPEAYLQFEIQAIESLNTSQSSEKLKHRILLQESLGAYVILNEEGQVKFASEEIQNIVGLAPNKLLNKVCSDFQHPEDRKVFQDYLKRLKNKPEERYRIKYRVRHVDGNYRWVRTSISNYLEDSEIAGFVMMVQDIDEPERELLDSNQRFKWASKATKDVIWDWRFKDGTISWGENLKEIFGWEAQDLNTTDKWISCIPEEDQQGIHDSLEKAFANGSEIWITRYRFKKQNGELAYILDRGYIERDSQGEAIRLIGAMHDYSEQYFYEHELKNERRKFQQLFEHSLIGAAMLNLNDLKWQDCNQSLLNILGFKQEEFLNLHWKDLIPLEERALNDVKIELLKAGENISAYQSSWLRKDLATTRLVVSAFKANDIQGNPIAWFHLLDLGPIEESNRALVEAESRFRQYIEKASDIFIYLSSRGEFEYISPNISTLLGFKPIDLLGTKIEEIIHPEELNYVKFSFQKAYLNPGATYRSVFRIKSRTNQWLWVEANGSFQTKGAELKAFINLRDIQKEHEAEAELRKLSLVANRTSNGVLIVDHEHRVEWINESFSKMSGYSLEELQGIKMEDMLHGENSTTTSDDRLLRLLEKKKPFRFENINYKKDGTEYWIESIVTPIFDDRGKLVNYLSIESDITERKLEEFDFQRNLQLISEQNERLRSFAHIVSHNFRSHGSNIHQLIHELNVTTDQILKEELHSFLEISSNGLMQALDELAGLLEVESASDLPTEELQVADYCKRIRQILSRPTMEANAELEFNIPEGFTVNFYPAYFESVLFNLVSNALRYHDPLKDPWVKVSVKEDEKAKYLIVADNGLGFDSNKHGEEVFKFKKSIHNHPDSSGIGLYLVRSQLESLGGEIKVESEIGKGSTFTIILPK
jgi:PAS domain S-box-containing protein